MTESRVVARFEIPFRAYLDANGQPLGELPKFVEDGPLLQRMYRMMVRARAFDTKAINLQRTGKLSLTFDHRVVTGGEAVRFLAALLADPEVPE